MGFLNSNKIKLTVLSILTTSLCIQSVLADPTREQVYSRQDNQLRTTVFKDDLNPNVFWFIPPVKVQEENGKIVYLKREKDLTTDFYIYLVPYITNEQLRMITSAIPGYVESSQLKPVSLKRIGISIPDFGKFELSEELTDLQYLNSPIMVKLELSKAEASDFEFLMNHRPGVQARVLFNYISQKADKYLKIELNAKQIYDALNIKVTGKYVYAKADIQVAVTKIISSRNMIVASKGDLPIPEIVQKVIEECFQPIQPQLSGTSEIATTALQKMKSIMNLSEMFFNNEQTELMMIQAANHSMQLQLNAQDVSEAAPENETTGTNVSDVANAVLNEQPEVQFEFKKELQESEKTFYYQDVRYVDTTEMSSVPVMLSLAAPTQSTGPKITVIPQVNKVVSYLNEMAKPLRTGIIVRAGEQYTIQSAFTFSSESSYNNYKRMWYRTNIVDKSVSSDLYYRIGDGPWQSVDSDNVFNGYAIIRDNGLYQGEIQFYLDRDAVWKKIDTEYTQTKLFGFIPAIFTYQRTYPQFNVSISGRKYQ